MVVKNTLAIALANVKLPIRITAITALMYHTRTVAQNGGQIVRANAKQQPATQIVMRHQFLALMDAPLITAATNVLPAKQILIAM